MSTTATKTVTLTATNGEKSAGTDKKRKHGVSKSVVLKVVLSEEEKSVLRKKKLSNRRQKAQKTVVGNSRNISAGNAALRKLIGNVWNEVYPDHELEFNVGKDVYPALNYYLIAAYNALLPLVSTTMFRLEKGFKTIKGQRTDVKARVNSTMMLACACDILPLALARDMQELYGACIASETTIPISKGYPATVYDMEGLLPKADQERAAKLHLNRYTVSTKAKIALSCYVSSILRRIIALGFALMNRAWVIPPLNLNNVAGIGRKTLGSGHFYIAVAYDSPEYNEGRERALSAFYSSNSPTQSQGLHYMPVEMCVNPAILAKFYPGFSDPDELADYEQRVADQRVKQQTSKRAKIAADKDK